MSHSSELPSEEDISEGSFGSSGRQYTYTNPLWEYFDRGPNLYKSSRVKEALCRYCVDKNGEKTILRGNYAGMYSHVITGKKFDKSVSLTISESFGNWYQI